MSTLAELQDKLNAAKYKKSIYSHLMEELETDFLSSLGGPPKKVLLTEDKLRVPVVAVEGVINDVNAEIKNLNEEIHNLLTTPLTEATVQ
jgi:hypothetical protein